jgi:Bacterial SH3 domain
MMQMHGIARFAFALLAAGTLAHGADLVAVADPMATEVGEVATPNHDPHHVRLIQAGAAPVPAETGAWNPVTLRAEPEVAGPSFVAADTMLYARANARLRAAPSTAAAVVAKLAANAPLRAIARSTDGAWWQVSLADRRTGYVHQDAVTKYRMAKAKPMAATAPVAAASPQPAPAQRSQGLLGLVDEAMNWLADVAGRGSTPKIIRAER